MLAGHLILVDVRALSAALLAMKAHGRSLRRSRSGLLIAMTGFEVLVSFLQAFNLRILYRRCTRHLNATPRH
jgi:F0F1-type ATP synthase membrane subunit a